MEPQEVKDVFVQELRDKSISDALVSSYDIIYIRIIEKAVSARSLSIDEKAWKIIRDISHANGRFCLIDFIFDDFESKETLPELEIEIMTDIISVYRIWSEVLNYLYDNYESFLGHDFQKDWPKDLILNFRDLIHQRCHDLQKQFDVSKVLVFDPDEFSIMKETFGLVQIGILSSEVFALCIGEFNKAVGTLSQCKAHMQATAQKISDILN